MKMEYIASGAVDTPLIRLYDFDEATVIVLHKVIAELEGGARDEVRVHELDGVEPVEGCRLTLTVGKRDMGVREDAGAFICVLRRETWGNVAFLIEPFCQRVQPGTFQYLDQTGDITLLLSVDGGW